MASITQKVSNYKSGISELPDELKVPGQVVDLKNAIPDITRGCIKRPGSDLIGSITPSTAGTGGKWFSIYTEQDEQYIGQVAVTGAIKVWRCSDGVEIPIDYANIDGTNLATYLIHTNSDEIQPLTINETTFFANRTKTVAMKTDAEFKTKPEVHEAYIALRTISYGKQYSLDIFDPEDHSTITYNRATAIEASEDVDTSTLYSGNPNNDGKCFGMSKYTVGHEFTKAGNKIGSTSPPVAIRSGLSYTVTNGLATVTCTGHGYAIGDYVRFEDYSADGSFFSSAFSDIIPFDANNEANTILKVLASNHTADQFQFNLGNTFSGSGTSAHLVAGKGNLRYEMDLRCTPVPQPGSTTSAYDDSYQPHPLLQFGGEGWKTGDIHIYENNKGVETQIKVTSHIPITSRANVALVRPECTSSNAAENVSAESILAGMKNAIDAIGSTNTGLTVTTTGNGIHLRRSTPFNVTSPESQLMDIITSQANAPDDLPRTCRHGYVVKVVNSGEDQDDYYVKFKVQNIPDDNSVDGTYTRTSNTITIAKSSHGLSIGDQVFCQFTNANTASDGSGTSSNATDGFYTIIATSFTADQFLLSNDSASGSLYNGQVSYSPVRFGEGVWEECAAPNLDVKFDTATMPIQMTRVLPSTSYTIATSAVNTSNEQITITGHGLSTGDTLLYNNGGGTTLTTSSADQSVYHVIKVDANIIKLAANATQASLGVSMNLTGTGNNAQTLTHGYFNINGGADAAYTNGAFRFGYPPWDDRGVGDDLTNPKPSFVGNKINKIFFFRNRIGLLSRENVILSRVNDFHNFWAKTAFTIANADPIDLQSTSTYPTELFDAIEVNAGLLMYSASQQFLLKTDEAQMTPETAIVAYLSSYAFNEKTEPFNMGTTAGWLNSTAKRTRFHEMAGVRRNGEPQVLEQSKVISKLFPDDITLVAESTENEMVLFASENSNEVWGYKYYTQGEQRIQSAWFRWELAGTVTFHCMLDDVYYAVLKNGSVYTLQSFDIKKATDTLTVGTSPSEFLIHLDTRKEISSGSLTYTGSSDKTSMTKPAGYDNSGQLAVFCKTAGSNIGRFSKATVNGSNIEWTGNWSGIDIVLGYLYEMEVELPTIFITKVEGQQVTSDTRGSLIVHRVNFSFGAVGLIDVTLKRKGRPDYNKSYESIDWDSYLANTLVIAEEYIHTIPIYERNTNLSIHLNSSHPYPTTLNSMTWEGDYNPKFYQRV